MEKENQDQFTGLTELLRQLINQSGTQNLVLNNILKQCEISVCLLETITRQTCMSLNEEHYQTELQKFIKEAISTLLEMYKSSHAEEFLKYEQIQNLKKELLKCCPPEGPEPFCKPDKIDCSKQGDDGDLDSGYTFSRLCDPAKSKISKEGYKPYKIDFDEFEDDDEIPKVTVGKFRGLNKPAIHNFNVLDYKGGAAPGGGSDPVIFNKFTNIGKKVTTGYFPPDMDGAVGGGVVLMTGNFFLGVSIDGGSTFEVADPTTIFPKDNIYGGWGCDQIMVFAPTINRFIWLMQAFPGTGGKRSANDVGQNIVRVAYASPEDVIKHKANLNQAFSYYDFDSNYFSLAGNGWMDYPDMSVGDNFLYINIDVRTDFMDGAGNKQNSTVGRLVFRIPLNELRDGSITNGRVTNAADSAGALKGQLTKNTGNEIYWAGHKKKSDGSLDNGTITLFSWNENSAQYAWRDVALQANWPSGLDTKNNISGTLSSLTPSPESVDWLNGMGGIGNAILGATVKGNEIWLAWTADSGDGGYGGFKFPHPHVQIAKIDKTTFKNFEQTQIWNPDHAYAFANLCTNGDSEVAISLAWGGGGKYYGSHAVGLMGDFVVWFSEASNVTLQKISKGALTTRWGDYVIVRPTYPNDKMLGAFGYAVLTDASVAAPETGKIDPFYVEFGRKSVVNPPPQPPR